MRGEARLNPLSQRDLFLRRGLEYEPGLVIVDHVLNDTQGPNLLKDHRTDKSIHQRTRPVVALVRSDSARIASQVSSLARNDLVNLTDL